MRQMLLLAVVAHFLLAGWHGAAHQLVPVPLATWQTAFVAVVILALPLAGAALAYSRRRVAGALLVFASLLASFVFGVLHHFVLISPDNISCVPPGPWRDTFVWSSIVIAVSEAVGAAVGAVAAWRWMKSPA